MLLKAEHVAAYHEYETGCFLYLTTFRSPIMHLSCHVVTNGGTERADVFGTVLIWSRVNVLAKRYQQWLFVCNIRTKDPRKKFRKLHATVKVMVCCVLGGGM